MNEYKKKVGKVINKKFNLETEKKLGIEDRLEYNPHSEIEDYMKDNPNRSIPSELVHSLLRYSRELEKSNTLFLKNEGKDSLTGLYENGVVFEKFKDLMLKSYKELKVNNKTDEIKYSFTMLDADDFTTGNSKKGHLFMDGVLIDLANIIKDTTRKKDLTARLGGEEMGAICRIKKDADALYIANNIRKTIESYDFQDGFKQTVSVGADIYTFNLDDVKALDKIFVKYDEKFNNTINDSRQGIEKVKQEAIDNYLLPIFNNLRDNSDNATYESKNKGKNLAFMFDKNVDYSKHRTEYDLKKKGLIPPKEQNYAG